MPPNVGGPGARPWILRTWHQTVGSYAASVRDHAPSNRARLALFTASLVIGRLGRFLLHVATDAAIVAVLAGMPFVFFWQLLTTTAADAATFPLGDIAELHYPYRRFIVTELVLGRLPFWDPYVSAGHPVLGDIQHALLYPIGLLIADWAGPAFPMRALAIQMVLHFSLAAAFTYLLGRRLLRTRAGAAFAAIVFTFGGYLTSFPVQQLGILQTAVWLPFILLFLDLGIASRSVALALPAALGIAAATLAGHPQTLLYVLVASAGYAIFRGWMQGWWGLLAAPSLLAAIAVGLGLAAGQLLPAFEHLQMTDRTTASFEFTTTGFALHELIGLVFPERFGGLPLYHGLLTLLLAGPALATGRRSRLTLFWAVLGLAALLVALGGSTFLQQPLYLLLGSFKLRDHQRVAFLVALALAMLAGRGLDVVLASDVRVGPVVQRLARWSRWTLIAPLTLLVLFLYGGVAGPSDARDSLLSLADRAGFTLLVLALAVGWLELARRRLIGPTLAGALAVALVAFDLLSTNAGLNLRPLNAPGAAIGSAQHVPETPIVQALRHRTFGLFRIASEGRLPADGNAGALYRIADVVGNSPLELESYHRFDREVSEWQRWRLLNVRYLVTNRDLDQDSRFRLVERDGDLRLYELGPEHLMPRAWLVYRTVSADSFDEALRLVDAIDPRREAVVTLGSTADPATAGELGRLPSPLRWLLPDSVASPSSVPTISAADLLATLVPPEPSSGSNASPSSVRVTSFEPNAVALNVDTPTPGLLVVSEVWHPSWRAWVDDAPAPVIATNAVLRGIPVSAGQHVVELRFESASHAAGVALAHQAATLGGLIILAELVLRVLVVLLRGGWIGRGLLERVRKRRMALANQTPDQY